MKILHIVNGNDIGGATTQVSMLIESQKSLNEEIFVLVLDNGKIEEFLQKKDVCYKIMNWKLTNLQKIYKFVKNKINENYIVHTHGLKPMIIEAMLLFFKNDKKFLTTSIHSDYRQEYKNKKSKIIAIPVFKYVCKNLNKFIVVSDDFIKTLINDGILEQQICFIPNGINVEDKKEVISKKEFLKRYDLLNLENRFICGLVARIHKIKGIDVVIEIANILKNENIVFLIAGEGDEELKNEYLNKIKEYSLKNIYFLGYVKDIENFYNSIDINLITSYSEAISYSLLEAALYQKAVICSDLDSFKKVITKDCGMLIETANAKEFSRAILKLYKNKNLLYELSTNLNKKIVENYNAKIMAKRYIEIYNNL